MKYISADKLIAEIERRIAQWQSYTFACASQIASEAFDRIDELKGLLIYITSLQQEQPEVDLEKIINNYFKDWKFDDDLDIMVKPNNYSASSTDLKNIARHFYELGFNARKK